MRFEVLFHFSHGPVHLVETKRLDLPPKAKPGEIYRWNLVEEDRVRPLRFVSMELRPQRRVFEEGSIVFDLQSCRAQLFGKSFELLRQDTLSEKLRSLLSESLAK